jgi:membrane protease YdiL (CAAX protease family)
MMPFAFILSHEVRSGLLSFIQAFFILFVLVSFVCVAVYTSRQMRKGQVFIRENPPLPIAMQPLSGWLFVVCVVGLIYLQSALYAIVVLVGIAGSVLENGTTIRTQFGFDRVPPIKALAWSLLIFGAVMLVETPLTEASAWGLDQLRISHPEQQSVETFRQYNQASTILWFLVQAVFLFPVIEELFFRGFLLTFLKNYTSTGMAIVLSGGVFAFAHLNLGAVLPLWFLGIVLGVAYQHTGSLLVPMGVHACFNLATALSLLLDKGNPS